MTKYPHVLKLSVLGLLAVGCSSFPAKKNVNPALFTESSVSNLTYKQINESLTTGVNNVMAGYSASVTPITPARIHAQQTELGKRKMDPQAKIDTEIKADLVAFTQNKSCFLVSVSTYGAEEAMFRNWTVKFSSAKDGLTELKFSNLRGMNAVPELYKDMNGRNFHNTSVACSEKPLTLTEGFKVFLMPSFDNNIGEKANSEFEWTVGQTK